MKEKLLYSLWSSGLLPSKFRGTEDQDIFIVDPGKQNNDSGPDFFNAHIIIDGIYWVGNVEMHIKSSHWFQHKHHLDEAYKNVILHIVFDDDGIGPENIPVLQVSSYLSKSQLLLLSNERTNSIYCSDYLPQIDPSIYQDWLQQLSIERLEDKSKLVEQTLRQTNDDWESCLFLLMSRSFGFKTNAEPFEKLANSIGLRNIRKLKGRQDLTDALLFGQSGMLQDVHSDEEYPNMLMSEYKWLKERFHLHPLLKSEWKFLRMRPRSFPSIRLAQLSAMLSSKNSLIYDLSQTTSLVEVHQMLYQKLHVYWDGHYTFLKKSKLSEKSIGFDAVRHILINAFIPFMYTFGVKRTLPELKSWAIKMLEETKAESNTIIRDFAFLNLKAKNAYQSQGLVQLKNEYCNFRNCLNCAIGKHLIRR